MKRITTTTTNSGSSNFNQLMQSHLDRVNKKEITGVIVRNYVKASSVL
ncbi:MAG: hypothetical protein ACTHKF_03550 [Candidatus Nitrosocosmicus sp.]